MPVVVIFAAMLLLAACGPLAKGPAEGGGTISPAGPTPPMRFEPPKAAPDFTLQDHNGQAFRLSDHRGQVLVLFFGYTTCPDVCPATIAQLNAVKEELGAAAAGVKFVFISVDPARDTPERMQRMLQRYGDEEFIGLTGDPADLAAIWQDYNVHVEQVPAEGDDVEDGHYWVAHSSLVYLVDTDGIMPLAYTHNFDGQRMVADLQQLANPVVNPHSLGPVPPIALDPPKTATDFQLQDQWGDAFRLSQQLDKAAVLFFGYTTCPDVCPATVAQLQRVKDLLGDDAARVPFIFITVDPARDTPERLQAMLSRFGDDFFGLSGDPDILQDVWQQYNIRVERESADDATDHYWVNHSSRIYLINSAGLIPRYYTHNFDVEQMAADIRQFISEGDG